MSQTDVLVELIRHATAGNQPAIRQSVERLIAVEEQWLPPGNKKARVSGRSGNNKKPAQGGLFVIR